MALIKTHPILMLGDCAREKRTGVLQVKMDKIVRQFRFKDGDLLSFFTNTKTELAATLLFKKNILSKDAYEKHLIELPALKVDVWDHFVQQGMISKEQMHALKMENLVFVLSNLSTVVAYESSFQPQSFASTSVYLQAAPFILAACNLLTEETIFKLQPAFMQEAAGIFLPKSFEKEIPPLPISPEERGLVVVIQHNRTVKDVFSSSFLGRERILKLLLAYWMLGWIIVKGSDEKAMDDLMDSLSTDQKKLRQDTLNLLDGIGTKTYYDWLSVPSYANSQEIQQASMKIMEHSHSPATEKVFLPTEKGQLSQILKHAEVVIGVLLHPAKRAQYDAFLQSGQSGSFAQQNQTLQSLDVIAQAQKLEKEGKKEACVRLYEDAIQGSAASVDIMCSYVLALLRMYGPSEPTPRDKALALMKNLLEKHSQDAQVLLCAAEWLKGTNQLAKAHEFMKKGFLLFPHQTYFRSQLLAMAEAFPQGPIVVIEHLYTLRTKLNLYQWLNITPQAHPTDIRKAYRDCSKALHPDRFFQAKTPELKEKSKEVYKRIVEAYSTLKDSNKKRSYDEAIFSTKSKDLRNSSPR